MDKSDKPGRKEADGKKVRRKYERPAVVSEEIFETTALACGKITGQGGRCNSNPKLS